MTKKERLKSRRPEPLGITRAKNHEIEIIRCLKTIYRWEGGL